MKTEEILNEREKTHGDFERFADLKCALVTECDGYGDYSKLSNQQGVAINMILTKVARIMCGDPNHADHWDDIAGYAMLGRGKDAGKEKFSGVIVIDDPRLVEKECNHDGWRICRKCGLKIQEQDAGSN